MSENFNAKGEIELELKGLIGDIDALTDKIGRLNETFGHSTDVFDKLERQVNSAGSAARKAAGDTDSLGDSMRRGKSDVEVLADGFDVLIDRLREYDSAAKAAAQSAAVGGTSPIAGAMGTMTLNDAKEILRTTEAQGMTAQRAAKQVLDANAQVQKSNSDSAKSYQAAFTDAKSYFGQLNSAEASTGLKASETTWALEARALEEFTASAQAAEVALPRLRYALYDVATTAGVMSASITAAGTAVLAMSGNYERSFTDVERTTLASAETTAQLREDLMQLTREIPESWGQITEIASVGAQLDIAEESLASFTDTTVRFSTVTGIAAETSAMAFGSLGQLLGVTASEYENMGSAIAYVGVTSVATDEEIIKMSQRLAASAANAGMTAQEVIALSGALASLRIAPERAQGVMEVYFKQLNNAIADGGERLEAFARYSGMATESVAEMVATDPAGFFRSLSQGLGSLDPVSTTLALDELGLSGIRAGEVFTRVSNNLEVFDQAMANSNQAWQDGTHLAHAYGLVVDDLASKWQIFLNALMESGAAVGDAIAPLAKALLDFLTPMLHSFSEFAQSDFGKVFLAISGGVGVLIAGFFGLVTAGALTIASMAAIKTAIIELGVTSGASIFSLKGLAGAFREVSIAANMSTGAVNTFKGALVATGIGALVVLLGTVAAAIMSAGDASEAAYEKMIGSAGGLAEAVRADRQAFEEGAGGILIYSGATEEASIAIDNNADSVRNAATILGTEMPSAIDATTGSLSNQTAVLGENTIAWAQNALMQSEEFQKLASTPGFADTWERIGADFSEVLQIAATEGEIGVQNYFIRLADATGQSAQVYSSGTSQIFQSVIRVILGAGAGIAAAFQNVIALWNSNASLFSKIGNTPLFASMGWGQASGALDPLKDEFRGVGQIALGMAGQLRTLGSDVGGLSAQMNDGADAASGYGGGLDNAGSAAQRAAEKVYTLKDYASDLSSVWDRAFDIRFSGEQTLDSITSAWSKIRKEISDAADAIAKYQAEMQELAADKSTMEYRLMVAENYGDVLRAEELRAKLAAQDVKLAEASKKLAAEQDKTNKTLEGNSDAAIKNRAEILSLVSGYQDHIEALASSGMSSEELSVKTAQLKQQFIEQAVQLGYSRAEVTKYAAAFDDVTFAINKIPRNITVTASTNAAQQAFNELRAAADKANNSLNGLRNNAGQAFPAPYVPKARYESIYLPNNIAWDSAGRNLAAGTIQGYLDGRTLYKYLGTWRKGGYTGDIPEDQVAGFAHGKEFVFSAPAVANLGVQNLALLHDAAKAGRGAGASMARPSGSMVVELSPYDRQLLVDVKNAAGINISADAFGRAALAGSVNSGRTGRG